jgi:hypothetical protein
MQTLFFGELKSEIFIGTFKFVKYFKYKADTSKVFAATWCRILRNISRKPCLNLWNRNLRTKNLIFRRIFAKKKLRGNWTLPSFCLKVTARDTSHGRQITNRKSRLFLRKNRFIHVLEMSKSAQNKQLTIYILYTLDSASNYSAI